MELTLDSLPQTTSVALVEDDPLAAEMIVRTLNAEAGFTCVGWCADGDEALERLPLLAPQVILFDLMLGGQEGFAHLRQLRAVLPSTPILALTSHEDSRMIYEALCAGAEGYLLKSDTTLPLTEAIRETLTGGRPFSRSVARRVLQFFHRRGLDAAAAGLDRLSEREFEVLQWISSGFNNREIALRQKTGEETVRKQVRSILVKLHAANRAEAAAIFARSGLPL